MSNDKLLSSKVTFNHGAVFKNGDDPAIALIEDGIVLEMHKDQESQLLTYSFGYSDYARDPKFTWSDDENIGISYSNPLLFRIPDSDKLLCMYLNNVGELLFRIAILVKENGKYRIDDWGTHRDVYNANGNCQTFCKLNDGRILLMYKELTSQKLCYTIGHFTNYGDLVWGKPVQAVIGTGAALATLDNDTIALMATFKDSSNNYKIFYYIGEISSKDNNKITWTAIETMHYEVVSALAIERKGKLIMIRGIQDFNTLEIKIGSQHWFRGVTWSEKEIFRYRAGYQLKDATGFNPKVISLGNDRFMTVWGKEDMHGHKRLLWTTTKVT